jgi:AraC-like DNA-binding protein
MIASHLNIASVYAGNQKRSYSTPKHQILLKVADRSEQENLIAYLQPVAEVVSVQTDPEAVDVLKIRPIQLIIASGSAGNHSLCRYIKATCQHAHIPVVELIPRDAFNMKLQCLESGADALLEKPVSRHILLAQVENLLSNRARIREHFSFLVADNPTEIPAPGFDEVLFNRLNQVIAQHLSNPDLDIDLLAKHLHMSRPTLYRKIADMADMTPSDLITHTRLKYATTLLTSAGKPIGDIAKIVGFHTRSGFGKAFQKQYHMTPTEYRQKAGNQPSPFPCQDGHLI